MALLVPSAVQVQLFPYAYAYVAPQAARLGARDQGDWARLSVRELLPRIPRDEFMICYPAESPEGDSMRYLPNIGRPPAEAANDCRTDPYSPLGPYHLADDDPDRDVVQKTFVVLLTRGARPGRNCTVLDAVTRHRYFERALMSQVALCDLVLNDYPSSGVRFGPDGSGADYLLGGWTSRVLEPGIRLVQTAGSLGFELPEGWPERSVRVELVGSAPAVPQILVNNVPMRPVEIPVGWYVDVPVATVAALGERRLAITLVAPDADEQLRLLGVRVVPL
jgi:hypothetical protein